MTGAELLKLPDRSVEIEQHVIGGLLLDNSAWRRVAGIVTAEDFYRADHQLIFQQIADLILDDHPADPVTVAERLDAAGKLEYVGGQSYLGALAANTPSVANIRRYAEITAEQARARAVIALGHEIADRAGAPGVDVGTLLQDAETRIAELRPSRRADQGWPDPLDLSALAGREPQPP